MSSEAISQEGERVSHLNRDHCFYAHLSIYDFAVPFCTDALVLDAGSGAGYGSAHLADAGVRHIWGIDVSADAVGFSQHHFQRANLEYRQMSLTEITGFSPNSVDLVFTSNVLEHVPSVSGFFREAWHLLKPTGTLIVAVPPITDDRLLYLNLVNRYHVNLWSPRQWAFVLGQFFSEITPYLHGVNELGADFSAAHIAGDYPLTEKSFVFERGTVDDMYNTFTLTAIFVATKPRLGSELPSVGAPVTYVDDSFTRPPGHIPQDVRKRLWRYFSGRAPLDALVRDAVRVLRERGPLGLAKAGVIFARTRLGL